jgi:hypothetical protein
MIIIGHYSLTGAKFRQKEKKKKLEKLKMK